MAIAYRYGVSELVDAYVLVFVLATLVPTLWTAMLQSIVVPQFIRLEMTARRRWMSELTGMSLVVGVLVSVLIWVLAPNSLSLIPSGLSPNGLQLARLFSLGLAPLALFGVIVSLFTAQLVALQKRSSSLLEVLPPLGVLVTVLLYERASAEALIVGSLIGIILHFLAGAWLVAKHRCLCAPRFTFSSPAWSSFWKAAVIVLFNTFLVLLVFPVDQYIALQIEEGAVARFGYASRLLAFLMALATIGVSRVILPALVHEGSAAGAWRLTAKWTPISFSVGLLFAMLAWVGAPLIITLLYEHGAFTSADSLEVTNLFRWGLIQLPFYFASVVLVQYMMSIRRYELMIIPTIVAVSAKLIASLVLGNVWGIQGLMVSSALMWGLGLFLYLYTIGNRLTRVEV